MSARFKALNAAQRTVVVGNGFHTIPNFGLSCSVSLSLSPYVKSPLAPSMSVRSFRGLMYEYAYTFVWRTSVLSLVSITLSGIGGKGGGRGGKPNRMDWSSRPLTSA